MSASLVKDPTILSSPPTPAPANRILQLNTWLDATNAKTLWDRPSYRGGPRTVCYSVGGRSVIALIFADTSGRDIGFDLFVPACNENNVMKTLNAAAKVCGIDVVVSEDTKNPS